MIQIDTNSPETGQAASQGLRNGRSDQNGDDPNEFAQIWSEFIEADSPNVAPPSFVQTPNIEQSDAASPDSEATEVRSKLHPVEFGQTEREEVQSTQPSHEGTQKLQAYVQFGPRAHQPPATMQAPDSIPMPGKDRSEVLQSQQASEQFVAPIGWAKTSIPALPIATAGEFSVPLPTPEKTTENIAVPFQTNTAPAPSIAVSPLVSGGGKTSGQFQRQLITDQAPVQTVVRDQDSNARLPIEVTKNQTQQVSALTAKPTTQIPLFAAPQAPNQTTAQEQPRAPQSVANPNSLAPSKTSSLAITPLPKIEPSIPILHGAPAIELPALQPLHSSGASVSTTVTPTPQPIAPQVASQIVAAISQPSGTTTEILLNPEELGRVRISLTNGDSGMTVNILAERAETTDLMRRNIELLARELRDMGYENPSFTFDGRSDGSSGAWDDEHPEPAPENLSDVSEPPTPSMQVTLTGGLDLKL